MLIILKLFIIDLKISLNFRGMFLQLMWSRPS